MRFRSHLLQRQGECEHRTARIRVLDGYLAAVRFDDAFTDVQAEARARVPLAGAAPVELGEDVRDVMPVDPRPRIAYANRYLRRPDLSAHEDDAGVAVLDGVLDEVDEDLLHLAEIGRHYRERLREVRLQAVRAAVRLRDAVDDLGGQRREVDELPFQLQAARFET